MTNGVTNVPSYSANYALGDGQSLYSAALLIMMERHGIYETELKAEYKSMQARNNLLKDLNSALETLRTERPTDEKTKKEYGTFIDSQGETRSVVEFMQENGIAIKQQDTIDMSDYRKNFLRQNVTDDEKNSERKKRVNSGSQADYDAAINNLKAAVDSANSEGQMSIVFFQGLLDKLNQVTELASNVISKDEKAKEAVIGNIR
ncbi:hypothetical protein [Bradyrhizobium sp. LeoA1S1]